jgi:hypothetical protein
MIIQQNRPQNSSRTLIHVFPATERTRQRVLPRGDACVDNMDVYDDVVSFYSLGAMTGHGAPPALETSIAGTVS